MNLAINASSGKYFSKSTPTDLSWTRWAGVNAVSNWTINRPEVGTWTVGVWTCLEFAFGGVRIVSVRNRIGLVWPTAEKFKKRKAAANRLQLLTEQLPDFTIILIFPYWLLSNFFLDIPRLSMMRPRRADFLICCVAGL